MYRAVFFSLLRMAIENNFRYGRNSLLINFYFEWFLFMKFLKAIHTKYCCQLMNPYFCIYLRLKIRSENILHVVHKLLPYKGNKSKNFTASLPKEIIFYLKIFFWHLTWLIIMITIMMKKLNLSSKNFWNQWSKLNFHQLVWL